MTEFSFQEICIAPAVSHDNQSRTIIHNKFHDPAYLEKTVGPPSSFDDDLQSEHMRRPLLRPMDFTRDWERDKKMRKVRSSRLGDDDVDFELEYEEAYESLREDEEKKIGEKEKRAVTETATATVQPNQTASKNTQETSEIPRYDSMDVVGKAIKNLMHLDDMSIKSDQPLTASVPKAVMAAPSAVAAAPEPLKSESRSQDFIPTGGTVNPDPEADAARLYQQRLAEEKLVEERVEQRAASAIEEAKAKGYRDGYVLGEEKAEFQARQKAAAMFGKVGDLVKEFSHLKRDILSNVQENFYELCQAMGEALLKREFSIKPEAFATVLRRAIDDAIAPGEFKIRVHPEMHERIVALGDAALTKVLVKDQEIALGDFKIESSLSVVDGQVSKLIKDLLDQTDLNIFDQADSEQTGGKKAS